MRKRLMGNYQPKKGVQSKEDGICIFYVMRDCKNNLFFILVPLGVEKIPQFYWGKIKSFSMRKTSMI